jgi:aspartate kinase
VLDLLESGSEREALLALIDSVAVEVRQLLEGIGITRQLTARTLDRVMAYGELLALHIARHVLANGGVDTAWTDARRLVVTDEMFGAASPLPDKTRVHVQATLRPLLAKHQCVLVQGFVGATEEGVVTTMGRESSTLTATLLAELLEAESVTLFTDVEGVRTADPHRFEHTSVHPRLSYDQAALAAGHGLKLLYATTMEPAKRAGIPVHIRSAQKPDGEHTEIGLQGAEPTPIVILAEGRVSVVLANQAKVLQAVGLLAAEVQGAESWHLVANPEEHAVELTVPPLSAEPIARRLHEWLNIRSSPSPNSRPADPTA